MNAESKSRIYLVVGAMLNGPSTGMSMPTLNQKAPAINGQVSQYPHQPQQNVPPYSVGSYVSQPQPQQPGIANAINQRLQRPPVSSNGGGNFFDQETGSWTTVGASQQGQLSNMQNQSPPPTGKKSQIIYRVKLQKKLMLVLRNILSIK